MFCPRKLTNFSGLFPVPRASVTVRPEMGSRARADLTSWSLWGRIEAKMRTMWLIETDTFSSGNRLGRDR